MRTRITAITLAIAMAAVGAACNGDENSPTGPSAVPSAARSPLETTSTAPRDEPTTAADAMTGAPTATFGDGAQTVRGFSSGRPSSWSEATCAQIEAPADPDVGYEFCIESSERPAKLRWFPSRGAEMRSRGLNTMGTVWVHELPQPKCHWAGGGTNPRENVVCRILWPGTTDPAKVKTSMDGSKPAICGRLKTGHFRRPETGVEIYFTASSVGNVFAGALAVTPEASGQFDSLQYRQIQIADLLEQLRGRGPGKRFRQGVPPLPVLFLQLQERLHRVVPLLWPRSAVRWPTVPDPGFAGLAPLPVRTVIDIKSSLVGVTVCNSIPRETHRGPARVRPSVPWSP